MRLFLALLFLFPALAPAQLPERILPTKTIAILRDEPSPHFEKIISGFLTYLQPLARDQYKLEVLPLTPRNASLPEIKKTLLEAFDNPKIDAIFTAGIPASHAALHLTPAQRTKPVIAGAIEFSDLENTLIAKDGSSKIPNYSFVLVPNRLRSDLTTLSSLAKTKVIHVILEEQIIRTLSKELTKNVDAFEAANDLDIRVVPLSPEDISLSNLPAGAKAVYIPVLPSLSDKKRHALFTTLTQRKKLHLSMLGPDDVDAGAFASVAPRLTETLYRRLGLNLHQALLGVNTTHLPVILRLADQLKINLATAREIGWSPDYDTSLSATFFKQDEVQKSSGSLTLESAMAMAAKRNPDIKIAKASWLSSLADIQSGIAQYAPTADLVGQAGAQGVHHRINSTFTPRHAGSVSLGIEVNKLLYSDQIYQQIEALSQRSEAVKLETQSVTLDTIETTAHAYLDCLLAEALYNIQRKDVQLVQENLGLSEIRREIGAQDNTDSLRWQASLASTRSGLIRADSNRRNARTNLNVALATDTQKHWALKDIALTDQQTYFLNDSFSNLVSDQKGFQGFIRFSRALASANAPELKSFDYNLRAEGIRLVERKDRHKKPQVALSASVQRVFEDSSSTSSGAQNEWTVGIGFTLPFLEKDLREADVSKINVGILQLQAQRQRAVYLIEQRALAACFNMAASHPAMRLSRRARIASEQNYNGVREKYSLGQVNVITLIDAQSNLLAQEQAEANATYSYLKDAISLQRSLAWFEYSKSKTQVADFIQHYHDFQKTGSAHVRVIKK